MQKYNFIFIVLCYRSTDDLRNFFNSIVYVKGTYKVIVVNSYYDDFTLAEFQQIALEHSSDFLNVPNKGYGYGNNQGIMFANKNYKYDFLVIANPDIEFQKFEFQLVDGYQNSLVGPQIKTKIGKNQNPYKPFKRWLINGMEYYGMKYHIYLLWLFGIVINKIIRETIVYFANFRKKAIHVDSLHGSCMLIGAEAMKKLVKDENLYDENMFLFSEEDEVGYKAKKYNIPLFYMPALKILHKEDGSTSLIGEKISEYEKQSYIYCYEKWNRW